jgi:PAS domain S-box-containing protein
MDRALRIVHLEDDPNDRQMIRTWLHEQNIAAEFIDVDNEVDFIAAFAAQPVDLVLSDKTLPNFDGLSALRFVRENYPHVPFVFVTGSMGEEAAIETMRDGATDYVLKDRLSRLVPAVERAVREAEQEEKARRIEDKNRQQAALLDKAQDAILVADLEGCIVYRNKSAERIYGTSPETNIGGKILALAPGGEALFQEARQTVVDKGSWNGEIETVNTGGARLTIDSHWTLMRDENGLPGTILIIDTDITEKKELEAKFLRSQRLDSIGSLASGIAHDLNNALAPVLMGSELLRTCPDNDRKRFLDIVETNVRRAADLVKQILSFTRGSEARRAPVLLKRTIREMGKMIQETFPKAIAFSVKYPGPELWTVQGDATEFHQVLMNLCVNARDAMKAAGGSLTITAQNFILTDNSRAASNGAKPGPYVMISVADTGSGIPPEVLPRIFEPFFTTKEGDQGTGLGLATVASIVKHHSGFMDIETQPGKGTEFKIYFPATPALETKEGMAAELALPSGHGEMILVIDDEEALLELTKTMLETFGYRVVTAHNGIQGIARFTEWQGEIKLVVTDNEMPQMDGRTALSAIKKLRPDIPVIIASGAKRGFEMPDLKAAVDLKSLAKPYSLDQLLIAVDMGLHHGTSCLSN